MRQLFGLSIFLFVLSGCSSALSEQAIQTAIAQTAVAVQPTSTSTLGVTHTATASSTPLSTETPVPPTDTATPVPTFTPTPDLRIIKGEPQNFILQKDDLPSEARYYLPGPGWTSPHHNSEIIAAWGAEKGRDYLERTGRIDGWWVSYKRGSQTVNAPEEMFSNLVMYESAEGAQLTILEYNVVVRKLDGEDWNYVEDADLDLGDANVVTFRKELQSNGKNRVWYRIEFTYRNYAIVTVGWGWEGEVTLEFVESASRIVLERLKAAPLSEP